MSNNLFNLGLSGLNAAQWGLNTTGQNISNASTPGYSVERPVFAETGGQPTANGYLPTGVTTATVTRAYSQYLTTELNNAQTQGGSLSTYYSLASQLNNLVGSPTSGISSGIAGYFTGLQSVANNASDPAARQTAISSAQTLADQINAAGQQYDQLRASVNTQLTNTVTQINTYSAQIAQLNQQIGAASSQGQPPNQLLDQRNLAVSNLSQLVGVQVVQTNGSYSVFTSGGKPLVVSSNSFQLSAVTSSGDPSQLSIAYGAQNASTPPQYLPDATVSGGTLGGLLSFRSQMLNPAEAQLGAIATSFASQVNAQNALGLDLSGNVGGKLFTVGSPTVYANQNNTGSATLAVSFANPAQPTTSDYTLSYDGTNYKLTDNSSGAVVGTATSLASPIGGLNFSLTGTMNAGDQFTVQPTRGALDGFGLATTSGSAIAAASPVVAAAVSTNSGSATITQGTVSTGYQLPATTTTLTYNANALPSPTLTGFPAGTTVTIAGTPSTSVTIASTTTPVPYNAALGATLTINSTTQPPPAGVMNGISVSLAGTPGNGDKFTISANTGAANDGRNALTMSSLITATTFNGSATLTTAYANYVNTIGNTTSQLNSSSTAQTSLVSQITAAQQSVSGVNLNEEASNLLQYQQLYQANSKVIQTASTLFQTLLGIFQ
jgi:flagellar hook-associated protein 1 FlgK